MHPQNSPSFVAAARPLGARKSNVVLPRGACALALFAALAWSAPCRADSPPADAAPVVDPAVLARIRDAAMTSDWAWRHLADLTDKIGPRLSGSPQNAAAVVQVAAALRATGARVQLQPVKVPHWVRGAERAELVAYAGQPAGEPGVPEVHMALHLTALGASAATPDEGLTARVIVARDFANLKAQRAQVKGSIVYFDEHFDQALADNGHAGQAYGQAGEYRFVGPSVAAEMGAVAVLLRSVGGAEYRLPHTGVTIWNPEQKAIPAAALAAEDGDLIARLAAQGPVQMKLVLTPRLLPDADSANVIADWPGREAGAEVVIVSGHLDSWDLGTGATDDGTGVIGSAAVIALLRQLDLHPRRTIRFVAWANEENGGRGSKAYAESVQSSMATQVAAIESDIGAGHALGVSAAVAPDVLEQLRPVVLALKPIGASVLEREEREVGADIAPLQTAGVPGFAPLVDHRHYFDYHHTAADTLDKVDPHNLQAQVAVLAVLAYYLAEMPQALPRFAVAK